MLLKTCNHLINQKNKKEAFAPPFFIIICSILEQIIFE